MLQKLRGKCVDLEGDKVLITDIARSGQSQDLTVPPNCQGLGRIRHFRTETDAIWPTNPLPRIPAENWLKKGLPDPLRVQVFQIAGCAWRCWYCYVPYADLRAHPSRATWTSAAQLVDSYLAEPDRPEVLDLSGGSPDLAPEWIARTMDALASRGQGEAVFLWSDDNLSSDQLIQPGQQHLLDRIQRYPGYARVCCIKGFDATSFAFNTGASSDGFGNQLRILSGYAKSKLDLYCYITMTAQPSKDLVGHIRRLMDSIDDARDGLLARVVPLKIMKFGAMATRVNRTREFALAYQEDVLDAWRTELGARGVSPIWEKRPSTHE
jgi:uncharacterized Fe-S cluster-containing radical SAM superfamily protein